MRINLCSVVLVALTCSCQVASAVWNCTSPPAGSQFRAGATFPAGGQKTPSQSGTYQQGEMVAGTWTGIGNSPAVKSASGDHYWTSDGNITAQLNGAGGVGFKVRVTVLQGGAFHFSPLYTVIP